MSAWLAGNLNDSVTSPKVRNPLKSELGRFQPEMCGGRRCAEGVIGGHNIERIARWQATSTMTSSQSLWRSCRGDGRG